MPRHCQRGHIARWAMKSPVTMVRVSKCMRSTRSMTARQVQITRGCSMAGVADASIL